jgi:uncharacterized repeat protein (TIGR01451 family)
MGAYESEHLALWVSKDVEDSTVPQGTVFSYTVIATNGSVEQITKAVISDTLPPSLTLAGPVVMTPHQPGAILATDDSDLPTVASQVIISAGSWVSFTIPVSVSWAITPDTFLHNTVWLTASQVITPQTDGRTIAVVEGVRPEIVATYPADGEWRVPLAAPVVITFSEPIAIFELAYQVEPDPGGWLANWNGPWTAVTLTHTPFQPGTVYTVTVTEAPDFKANPLKDAPVSWRFSTPLQIYLPLVLRGSS